MRKGIGLFGSIRESVGASQEEFALFTGMSKNAYAMAEQGNRSMNADAIQILEDLHRFPNSSDIGVLARAHLDRMKGKDVEELNHILYTTQQDVERLNKQLTSMIETYAKALIILSKLDHTQPVATDSKLRNTQARLIKGWIGRQEMHMYKCGPKKQALLRVRIASLMAQIATLERVLYEYTLNKV